MASLLASPSRASLHPDVAAPRARWRRTTIGRSRMDPNPASGRSGSRTFSELESMKLVCQNFECTAQFFGIEISVADGKSVKMPLSVERAGHEFDADLSLQ